ncbi:S8 family serine peptidase [Lysobacter sp. BMK333-48F3]|uniref:S8 family serine peptidase n=1 Tax=Lysobacter sp. BMK333-48F3 TaxID=2867962 RepID=UPI001C8B3BF3|nr:S8 family serine peptidase [Lysobacter sp. BMK333-48F3]MBX9402956.1 S8 family serine peptidase [Lysobacter sp. BMK333-48F3]
MTTCRAWAFVLTLFIVPNAGADPVDLHKILARAVKQDVSLEMVKTVAERADATTISRDERATGATVKQAIERACGSVQDGYVSELEKANGISDIDLEMRLDAPGAPDKLPACLYVYDAASSKTPIDIVVQENDNAATLYERMTGKKPDDKQLTDFFGRPLEELAKLHRGDVLRPSYITQPVLLTVSGADAANLASQLSGDIKAATSVKTAIASPGKFVVPIEASEARFASHLDFRCALASAAMNGEDVERALTYSRNHPRAQRREVDVMVVDNGFLGADPNHGMFVNSAFDPDFFAVGTEGEIAKSYTLESKHPAITEKGAESRPGVYGHGTHVAGLILGGPDFPKSGATKKDKSDVLAQSVRLTVLNVADANHTPFNGAQLVLGQQIDANRPWIVNMSLAYDGAGSNTSANDVRAAFLTLVQTRPQALFVVAAGNDGGDVEIRRVYPAILGGRSAANVVTVAALDGNGRIARFSNRGDKVDIAAPGCMIESWTDMKELTSLSGTSQSAPQVTFVSSLLGHLMQNATPLDLKARLIASGDTLAPQDLEATAFGVRVNPAIAMYVFDDYVQSTSGKAMLGEVVRVEGLECPPRSGDHDPQRADDLWSIKRTEAGLLLFAGKENDTLKPPCRAIVNAGAKVVLRPTHELTPTGYDRLQDAAEIPIPMRDVTNVVFASKLR